MPSIAAMPLISRSVPAFTNDDFTGAFPASHANNSTYGDTDYWRTATAPISNANSGTLTQACYLAYDLSGVPSVQRGQVLLVWYDDCPGTGAYDAGLIANPYINLANAYTIDVNPAAGGTLPTTGWVTKVTVTGNTYHSRQHLLDMTGNNWIRINVTAVIGSASNNNVAMNMDVHDAHLGNLDNWIFYGDSITQRGLDHDDKNGIGNIIPAQIGAARSGYYPIWEGAGVGGFTATDMQPIVATNFMPLFTGHYIALPLGTNDANGGGALTINFQAKMQSMITSILNAGKVPVIPHIPYGTTTGILANGPTVNGIIDTLIALNPGCLAGPDLWAYFQANPTLISGDGIHPTDPAGYAALRTQWVNWALSTVYSYSLMTRARSTFVTRMVLADAARSRFLVGTPLVSITSEITDSLVASFKNQNWDTPYSTVTSTATVTNQQGQPRSDLSPTVQVRFPDDTTTTYTPALSTAGVYVATYVAKGPGIHEETWTFTGPDGSTATYECFTPVTY